MLRSSERLKNALMGSCHPGTMSPVKVPDHSHPLPQEIGAGTGRTPGHVSASVISCSCLFILHSRPGAQDFVKWRHAAELVFETFK